MPQLTYTSASANFTSLLCSLLFPEPVDLTKAKAKPQLTVTLPDGQTHTPPQAANRADQPPQNPFSNHVLPSDSTQARSQQPAQTGSSRGPSSGQASTSAATHAVGMNGSGQFSTSGAMSAPSQQQQQHAQLQQATPFANRGTPDIMQSSSNGSGLSAQQQQQQQQQRQQQLPIVSYDGTGVSSPAEWQAAWDSKLQPAQTSQAQTQGSLRGLHDDTGGHQQSASPSSDAQADTEPSRFPHQHSAHSAAEASSSSLSPAGVALAQQMAASNPDATQKLMEFSLQWLNNHADSLHQEEARTGRPAQLPGGPPGQKGQPITQMHGMPSVDAAGTVIGTGTAKAPEEASSVHVEELTEDDTRELMQALMAGQSLYAPRPGKLDLQYKVQCPLVLGAWAGLHYQGIKQHIPIHAVAKAVTQLSAV